MGSLNEISLKYENILRQSKQLADSGFKSKIKPVADDVVNDGKAFFTKLNTVLSRLKDKYPNYFEFRNSRFYVKGESRSIDYNYSNSIDIATEASSTINETLKAMLNGDMSSRNLTRLGVAMNTFYLVIDNFKALEDAEIKKEKQAYLANGDVLAKAKQEANRKIKELENEVHEYFMTLPKDIRSLSIDEAYEEITSSRYFYSHKIEVGTCGGNYSKNFKDFISSLGYSLNGGGYFFLENQEGKNVTLINCEPSYLRRNADFEDALRDMIMRSFKNFRPNEYEVALIEGEDGEVMLGPVADFVKKASNDLIYGGDVADNPEKTAKLIRKLNDEVRSRIRLFKSTYYLNKKHIDEYNAYNKENPLKYIFLVVKDYPSGFENSDILDKLRNIIIDGGPVGVMVLLIGKNEEIALGTFSKLEPLEIPASHIINVNSDRSLVLNDSPFELILPQYRFDDVEFLKKRIKNASNFSLSSILEDKPSVPFYEEIAIPLGKVGGDTYSLVARTEKPPHPFILVTGTKGTGKSAFMHEIILSGAYKYSPDELELHVIDFKSADKATEFALYQYPEKMYIPHIKYLSLKSRPENALDIINYIQKLKSKRNRQGKFKFYNEKNPDKKMPLIYVIIDEYESMLSGGEESGTGYESIALQGAIQDGITKIIKTARTFGIGLIFSGQALKNMPNDVLAQISTKIAFKNDEGMMAKMFPGYNVDLKVFPTDDYRGLAYTSSNDSTPKLTKFAWAGDEEKMAELAKTIREKYPEHTKKHVQSIIGATGSAEIRLDSFDSWEEEIKNRLADEESNFDNREQFLSSKQDKLIKLYRPLALGQSSSSEATVYLDYQKDENGHNFFAFGRNENLCPIERNLLLSFLYQVAVLQLKDKHIIFMDGSRFGVKDELFSNLLEKYPYILKQVEYITDKREMAHRLLTLSKHMKENKNDNPYLIIMHEIDWLDDDECLPSLDKKVSKQDDSTNNDIKSSLAALGGAVPAFLMNANFAAASKKEEKEDEFPTYGLTDVKNAFQDLYFNGPLFEHFMLVSSIRYETINKHIINSVYDTKVQEQIKNYSVYGSYDMYTKQALGDKVNANICYVINGSNSRSTTRLFDYLSPSASEWWERLEKMMYIWR